MSNRGDDESLEQPNDTGNPPTPANEGANANTDRSTRSITVSIQYSYFNPNGFANPNQPTRDANGNEYIPPVTRPDGALILSFRDVPTSTPQERLESIISIAAELAMRGFSDLMSQPKGITKEQFEQLPTVRISELPDEQSKICSICYDNYEDESENILKRNRDDSLGDRMESIKKQRSESPAVVVNPQETSAENPNEQGLQSPNEHETPTYRHSPIKLPCGHFFGRECLFKWSQLENSCPLCRQKIVEAAAGPNETANENMANLNADAFERIRQALYNNPQQQPGEEGRNDTTTGTGNTGGGNDLQNFTFSRSGIVLLRPDGLFDPAIRQASNTPGAEEATEEPSASGTPPTNGLPGFSPFAPGGPGNGRRIQWIPLPVTRVQTGPNNGINDDDTNGSGSNENNARSPNDRLRAILNNILSAVHSTNTEQEGSAANPPSNASRLSHSSTGASSDDRSIDSNASMPRRRSFLDHILRITNRHRNRSDNDNSSTNGPSFLHSGNNMFNSGVASYRNQNGQVSTYNLNDGPLPQPPQRHQSDRSAPTSEDNENPPAYSRSNNGEDSNENNDTSS